MERGLIVWMAMGPGLVRPCLPSGYTYRYRSQPPQMWSNVAATFIALPNKTSMCSEPHRVLPMQTPVQQHAFNKQLLPLLKSSILGLCVWNGCITVKTPCSWPHLSQQLEAYLPPCATQLLCRRLQGTRCTHTDIIAAHDAHWAAPQRAERRFTG